MEIAQGTLENRARAHMVAVGVVMKSDRQLNHALQVQAETRYEGVRASRQTSSRTSWASKKWARLKRSRPLCRSASLCEKVITASPCNYHPLRLPHYTCFHRLLGTPSGKL